MTNERIYPDGIIGFNKPQGAPDFVLGQMAISLNKLVAFCKAHPELLTEYNGEKQIKLEILVRKDGKGISFPVNTYKPQGANQAQETKRHDDDLPF